MVHRPLTIAIVFLATVLSGYAALNLMTERYEAHGRLLVKLGRENTEVPLTVEKGSVFTSGVQKEEINSYILLLSSKALVEETVDAIGLDRFNFQGPPPATMFQKIKHEVKRVAKWTMKRIDGALITLDLRKSMTEREKVVRMIRKGLVVVRERGSNVILTSIRLPDPQLAKQVVEVMITNYMRRHIALRGHVDARNVFDEQMAIYRKEIAALQADSVKIKRKWKLSSVDEQRTQLVSRLHSLKREVDGTQTEIERFEGEQQLREEVLKQLPLKLRAEETIQPNPRIEAIQTRMADLRLKRVRTAARYFEDSELVMTIDREMQSLIELLSAEGPTRVGELMYGPHPLTEEFAGMVEHTRVQLAGLRSALQVQRTQVEAIEEALRKTDDGAGELRMVDLQLEVTEKKYFVYATRREEARIAQLFDAHNVANVTLLSEPTAETLPVYPRKMLTMAVTAVAGLLLGVAMAMLLERRRAIIYASEDLAEFHDFPVLGVLRLGG